jgi:hypothetical protein
MRKIPLTNSSLFAIVDKCYAEKVMTTSEWYLRKSKGEVLSTRKLLNGHSISLSGFILRLENKQSVPRHKHHLNGNRLDNRSENLICKRKVTNRGIKYNKSTKTWKCQINFQGSTIFVGCFENQNDARVAYNNTLRKIDIPEQQKKYNEF